MLREILNGGFEKYDFLGHLLVIDSERGDMHFEDFKSDPDSSPVRGLSRASLDFLAQIEYAPRGATHVHLGNPRRVCIEGRRDAMENYTAYSVAYFKER